MTEPLQQPQPPPEQEPALEDDSAEDARAISEQRATDEADAFHDQLLQEDEPEPATRLGQQRIAPPPQAEARPVAEREGAQPRQPVAGGREPQQQIPGAFGGSAAAGQIESTEGGEPAPGEQESTLLWDAWQFAIQAPGRSIAGGVVEAGTEMAQAAHDLMEWGKDIARRHPSVAARSGPLGVSLLFQALAEDELGIALPEPRETIPQIPEPTTTAGRMLRDVSQFLAGMAVPLKALKVGGLFVRSSMAGAFADGTAFDPHEKRLSNLIQQFPSLKNPVSEFLAARPGDSEAMGRFKNALEGLGLGVIAEGFGRGLRVIRAGLQQRGARPTLPVEQVEMPLQADSFNPLGKPKGRLTTGVEIDETLRRRVAGKVGKAAQETEDLPPGSLLDAGNDRGLFINWARIQAADDLRQVIQQAADLISPSVRGAQRGVQSNELTQQLAERMGLTVDQLLARRRGEPLNAETAIAARKLLAASADRLMELARTAADPNAGLVDAYNFRRMMTIHHALQKEVFGARTETARALQSWSIPVGSGEEQARALRTMMEQHGGDMLSRGFAEKLVNAQRQGLLTSAGIEATVRRGALARTYDALQEAFIAGLLTNPQTHVVNALSNTYIVGQSLGERALAARVSQALGTRGGVEIGEATEAMFGILQGFKDIWRHYGKHARMAARSAQEARTPSEFRERFAKRQRGQELTGSGAFMAPGLELSKIDLPQQRALSTEHVLGRQPTTPWGKVMAGVVDGFGASYRTATFGALQGSDRIFKTLGYRMELHARALRIAKQEGLEGPAMEQRIAEIVADPPNDARMAAVDNALYQTFTNRAGPVGRTLQKAVREVPVLRFVALPFVRVADNLVRMSFERTPLASLVQRWRADIAAGGHRRDLAMARTGLGTAFFLTAMDMVQNGNLTGGGPPGRENQLTWRRGHEPYSFRVGDRWFSYERLDPWGLQIGLAADISEFIQWHAVETEDAGAAEELPAAFIHSISSTMKSKTWLRGPADLFSMMGGLNEGAAQKWLEQRAGSLIPAGVGAARRIDDPYLLEVSGMLEAFKSRTPGWSRDLPPVRDLWGERISYRSGISWVYDALSPIYSKRETPTPVDAEMQRMRMTTEKPRKTTHFSGVAVDLENFPRAYDTYVRLAGNDLKLEGMQGMGAKDYLNATVQGLTPASSAYLNGTDEARQDIITDVISTYREAAKQRVLQMHPDLQRHVERKRLEEQADAMGITLQ